MNFCGSEHRTFDYYVPKPTFYGAKVGENAANDADDGATRHGSSARNDMTNGVLD